MASKTHHPFEIAIIGGGVIGLILAVGLIRRNISVKVYEQSGSFREIGAGIAFTANAIQCMKLVEPQLVAALKRVATSNGDSDKPEDSLRWVDGFNQDVSDPQREEVLFQLYTGPKGFEGCHRAHLLDEICKLIPEGVIKLKKRLKGITHGLDQGKVHLGFADGTSATADALIGCDGIKSSVREMMFGRGNPMSYPTFTHKVAYRGLVPMDAAESAIGYYKAHHQHMHLGPGAHVLHFPVAEHKLMNVVAFADDPDAWESPDLSCPALKTQATACFANFGPTVRAIIDLLPEVLDKWAIFDMRDHPLPYYAEGPICLAGDAAHPSAPHHGAGAGIGVEDALALCRLFELVCEKITHAGGVSVSELSSQAFAAFSRTRRERTQWLVDSSRRICDVYEWKDPKTGADPAKCLEEITWRSHKIWNFDIEGMLVDVATEFVNLAGGHSCAHLENGFHD